MWSTLCGKFFLSLHKWKKQPTKLTEASRCWHQRKIREILCHWSIHFAWSVPAVLWCWRLKQLALTIRILVTKCPCTFDRDAYTIQCSALDQKRLQEENSHKILRSRKTVETKIFYELKQKDLHCTIRWTVLLVANEELSRQLYFVNPLLSSTWSAGETQIHHLVEFTTASIICKSSRMFVVSIKTLLYTTTCRKMQIFPREWKKCTWSTPAKKYLEIKWDSYFLLTYWVLHDLSNQQKSLHNYRHLQQ